MMPFLYLIFGFLLDLTKLQGLEVLCLYRLDVFSALQSQRYPLSSARDLAATLILSPNDSSTI
tara:strand:- start:4925 stop:5113 length:189 start_codon:yes stop_codon:yes gene_type:complete